MQRLRRKFALGAALPRQVSPGALVDQRALLDMDDEHERTVGQGQPLGNELQRGTDAVRADLADECLQRVHLLPVHGPHLAGVRHAEDHGAADGVAESGQFVGDRLPTRRANPVAGEPGFLELDAAVLAKLDLLNQAPAVPGHQPLPLGKIGRASGVSSLPMGKRVLRLRFATLRTNGELRSGFPSSKRHGPSTMRHGAAGSSILYHTCCMNVISDGSPNPPPDYITAGLPGEPFQHPSAQLLRSGSFLRSFEP